MSILIKGLKVHRRSCWECPCFDGEYGKCNVLKKNTLFVEEEDCPLMELPDHGDLIDRDEFEVKHINGRWHDAYVSHKAVLSAPVVIPAERSEE